MKTSALRRLIALLCCAALLAPCLPAALAAEGALMEDGFEDYASQDALLDVWPQKGNTEVNLPQISTEEAHSGSCSLLLDDTETNKSIQARRTIGSGDASEYVLTTWYKLEDASGVGKTFIKLYASSGSTMVGTYSSGKWDPLSTILTVNPGASLYAFLGSNNAPKGRIWFDDVAVYPLTEALALSFIEEKLSIPGTPDLIMALQSAALGLDGMNADLTSAYARFLSERRAEKGSALTKADVQACVDKANNSDPSGLSEGFEGYSEGDIPAGIWTSNGNSKVNAPTVTAAQAHTGSKSLFINDTEDDAAVQMATPSGGGYIVNQNPAGTEYVATVWYKVTGGGVFFLRLQTGSESTDVSTGVGDDWTRLSVIRTTTADQQNLRVWVYSKVANVGAAYFDDLSVRPLTPELALEYIEEKLTPDAPILLGDALTSSAMALTDVDDDEAAIDRYAQALKAARTDKGSPLTRDEIQACVDEVNMQTLAQSLGGELAVSAVGAVPLPEMTLPHGVSAQWTSVSPAGAGVTVSGGTAAVTNLNGPSEYTLTLTLSSGSASCDVTYRLALLDAAELDARLVREAADALTLLRLPVSAKGKIAPPAAAEKDGVKAVWTALNSDPGGYLSLADGALTARSLPAGTNFAEAEAVLTLTRGGAAATAACILLIYDPAYRVPVDVPNPGFEQLDAQGSAVGWNLYADQRASLTAAPTEERAHSGRRSLCITDEEADISMGVRNGRLSIAVETGAEYEAVAWVTGKVSTSADLYLEFNTTALARKTPYVGKLLDVSDTEWRQVRVRGVATTPSADVLVYSNQPNTGVLYFDDVTLWKLTEAGILYEIDRQLTDGGSADGLYSLLSSPTLGLTGLSSGNAADYFDYMAGQRRSSGRSFDKAGLQSAVTLVNDQIVAANREAVANAVKQIATRQTVLHPGQIPYPAVSGGGVSFAWTAVSGAGAGRVRVEDGRAYADTLPATGAPNETATLTLTVSKGSVKQTVDILTTLRAYTKDLASLITAAEQMEPDDYLNEPAGEVKTDLAALPTALDGGISVSWQALDPTTGAASSALSASGKVTRPAYGKGDAPVILRATLKKGSETFDRDFGLIVAGWEADDARLVALANPGFEQDAPVDVTVAPAGWVKEHPWIDTATQTRSIYANVDPLSPFTGKNALRLIGGTGSTPDLQSEITWDADEGHRYRMDVMVCAFASTAVPSAVLNFRDNEGLSLGSASASYAAAPGERGMWKQLTAEAVAPVGTVAVTVNLKGGSGNGASWFDDVRVREYPLVRNGSFVLGTDGWTGPGTAADGLLTLTGGAAVGAAQPITPGQRCFLTAQRTDGGTLALRFADRNGKVLTTVTGAHGETVVWAHVPAEAATVVPVLTGPGVFAGVKLTLAPYGTAVADGDFEDTADGSHSSPWTLTNASAAAGTGRSGAGLTIRSGGSAVSNAAPAFSGKRYIAVADVKGAGTLEVTVHSTGQFGGVQHSRKAVSSGGDWTTLTVDLDTVPEGSGVEIGCLRVKLSGAAVFDNVAVYSVTDSASNASMELLNGSVSGTFPVNWCAYGTAAARPAHREGEASHGTKSLAVERFGLGEGGARSSLVKGIVPGRKYEASVKARGAGELAIRFYDALFAPLGSTAAPIDSKDWQKFSVIAAAPAGAAYAALSVGGSGFGTVYADEALLDLAARQIGQNTQLFFDDWLVGSSSGVTRTFHEGEKTGPLFSGAFGMYAQTFGSSIVYDPDALPYGQTSGRKGVYKLWYQTNGYRVSYAESTDGVTWNAPVLGIANYNGSTANNICAVKGSTEPMLHVQSVWLDGSDPARRFKAIAFNNVQSITDGRYDLWTSADGFNWEFDHSLIVGQDVSTMSYDPYNKLFVGTFKVTIGKRTHRIALSRDNMQTWSTPVRMYSVVVPQDTVGYVRADGYGDGVYPVGDSWVGFSWRYRINEITYGGVIDAPFLFSRDLTEDWQTFRKSDGTAQMAVSLGKQGEFDHGMANMGGSLIDRGDELWFYYAGWSDDHNTGIKRTAAVGAAKWRRDGFVSMDFGPGGTLTTAPFVLAGTELHLNAKVNGTMKAELLDENGAVLATASVTGDKVDHLLAWDKSIAARQGKAVQLRLTADSAELYSLRCAGGFADVSADAWYASAVNWAVENGVMSGYSAATFGPEDNLNRAMLVQMLYNREGKPAVSGQGRFTDVASTAWYASAVNWAAEKGVVSGYGTLYKPEQNITRQELAQMLYNYAGKPAAEADLGRFADAAKIDGWATAALKWAVANGVMSGKGGGRLDPQGRATRAEAAQMFKNFMGK